MYLCIFSCLECNDCAVTFAPRFVSHVHLFCSSAASSTSFFVPWFSHCLFPSDNWDQGWVLPSDPWILHRPLSNGVQNTTKVLFISNSPGYFKAYWFDLRGFSRILICLQKNILGSQICSTYDENLVNCLCPLHAFTHGERIHLQRRKAHASVW